MILSIARNKSQHEAEVVDGATRANIVRRFLNNEFPLKKGLARVTIDGRRHNISGKKYDALPTEVKSSLKETQVTIFEYSNVTAHERAELYRLLNSGKPVNRYESRKAIPGDASAWVENLSKHSLFERLVHNNKRMQRIGFAGKIAVTCAQLNGCKVKVIDFNDTDVEVTEEKSINGISNLTLDALHFGDLVGFDDSVKMKVQKCLDYMNLGIRSEVIRLARKTREKTYAPEGALSLYLAILWEQSKNFTENDLQKMWDIVLSSWSSTNGKGVHKDTQRKPWHTFQARLLKLKGTLNQEFRNNDLSIQL